MNKPELKKVKIVATLGPKSDSKENILKLAQAGVDVFRFNMSHCPKEEALERKKNIVAAEKVVGRKLTIMGDLMGPKIRIGEINPEGPVVTDDIVEFVPGAIVGNPKMISVNIPNVVENLEKGNEIYLGDGDIKLEVIEKTSKGVKAKVIVGGEVRARMGFSAKALSLANFALTAKDKNDIKLMLEIGADALAVSFVQTERDIKAVRALLPKEGAPFIIAKLETLAGVENAEKILLEADGLMVARGDLGFAVPMPELPHIQKDLINLAMRMGKPVITATQMLESMTNNHLPTRAEVTDVANAILDGTDAVMLSGETAKGKFPVIAVETMASIIRTAQDKVLVRYFNDEKHSAQAITSGAEQIADQIGARLIVVFTTSGRTARLISRHRPNQVIIALSPDPATMKDLNFTWGTFPMPSKELKNVNMMLEEAKKVAKDNPFIKLEKGEAFVVSAGIPFGESVSTNMVYVDRI